MIDDDHRAGWRADEERGSADSSSDSRPRTRWRDFPATGDEPAFKATIPRSLPETTTDGVDIAEPLATADAPAVQPTRTKLLYAAGFGIAALIVLGFSIMTVRPPDLGPSAEVKARSEVASTTTTTRVESSTTVEPAEATQVAGPIAVDVAEGQIDVVPFGSGLPQSAGEYSFAVRLRNTGDSSIPVAALVPRGVLGGDELDVTFVPEHDEIPAGGSAVGLVRTTLPRAGEAFTLSFLIGETVVGEALVE